jgi:hypothetical protein
VIASLGDRQRVKSERTIEIVAMRSPGIGCVNRQSDHQARRQ